MPQAETRAVAKARESSRVNEAIRKTDTRGCPTWAGAHATPTYWPSTQAKISGATIVASLSTMNFGVLPASLPQVIFSFGTAPE